MRIFSSRKLTVVLFAAVSLSCLAQNNTQKLTETILQKDALFWNAYNSCNIAAMPSFFTEDVEFYHDKGGITLGAANLVDSVKKGLCSTPGYHLRREAVPGTVKVFPLEKNGTRYGAVISGEHYFYITDKGKPEFRDSVARFFHVWLLKDGEWRMARVISYDHGPAPYENTRKDISIEPRVLDRYTGTYEAPKTGKLVVGREQNVLTLSAGSNKYVLYPESETLFFTKDRDLTFEFVTDGEKVSKLVIREHGAVVEEAQAVR